MVIPCNELNQTRTYLLQQFKNCKRLKAEDMTLFVNYVYSVDLCAETNLDYIPAVDQGTISNTAGTNAIIPLATQQYAGLFSPEEKEILANLVVDGLVYPGVVTWSGVGFIYNVSQALIKLGGEPYLLDTDTVTLDAADPTNTRIDVIYASPTGFGVLTGIPAVEPVMPQVDPATQVFLTSIIVVAATTQPGDVTGEDIYQENVEYTGSFTGTGTVDFANAENPSLGTLAVKLTNIAKNNSTVFNKGSEIEIADFDSVGLKVRLSQALLKDVFIGIGFLDASDNIVSNEVQLPLNRNLVNTYQFVAAQTFLFNFTGTPQKIYIKHTRTSQGVYNISYFIDEFKLQGGINQPNPVMEFKVQDENGVTQFTTENLIKLEGVTFNPVTKVVTIPTPVLPSNTSDLTNDGEDGVNPFITATDVTTPTLQEVTDEGNETTNMIKVDNFNIGSGNAGFQSLYLSTSPLHANPQYSTIIGASAGFGSATNVENVVYIGAGAGSTNTHRRVIIISTGAQGLGTTASGEHQVVFRTHPKRATFKLGNIPDNQAREYDLPNSNGTLATEEWVTGQIPTTPTQEQIIGTAIENAAVTGTYNLDLSTFSDALLNLTGNTTITVTNTPAAGKSFVKTLVITSAAAETLTLPSSWFIIGTYDPAEINFIEIKFSNYTTAGAKVLAEITAITPQNDIFIMVVQSDNAGTSGTDQFTIPTTGAGYLYDIETSDGYVATGVTGAHTITFPSGAGTREVFISGDFPRIRFNNGGDRLKVLEVTNWGNYGVSQTDQSAAFRGCTNLTSIADNGAWFDVVTTGIDMFLNSSLTSLPSGMELPLLTIAIRMFLNNSLTSLPAAMTLPALLDGDRMFLNNSLTSLPTGMTLPLLSNGANMFTSNTINTTRYSQLLVDLKSGNPNNSVPFHGGNSKYNATGETARNILTGATRLWTITDGGLE